MFKYERICLSGWHDPKTPLKNMCPVDLELSENGATPKSSILVGFSMKETIQFRNPKSVLKPLVT
jgi:hypothetical protein